jgi:hypothetical protein
MLEESMSVWLNLEPASPSLSGSEGALVSVSIDVKPRYLESLLEALAQLPFPINPEIYHDAALVSRHADGREAVEEITLVEFPAYAGRLEEVRRALDAYGFDRSSLQVTSMLDEIQTEAAGESGMQGATCAPRRVKRRHAAAAHGLDAA